MPTNFDLVESRRANIGQLIWPIPLACGFVAALLIANTVSVKVMGVLGLLLPAGIVVYPLVSVMGDVITEVYGYRFSRRVIWSGFAALLLQNIVYLLARIAPPADFWPHQAAFDQVLGMVPRIAAASLLSYPIGEFVNAYVLAKLKISSGGKQMGLRFFASTLAGQGADSIVFITFAFVGTMAVSAMLSMLVVSWVFKVVWELAALPLSIRLAGFVKRTDKCDVLDVKTDFSPVRF